MLFLRCDCGSGPGQDSYLEKNLTFPSDFWVEFDLYAPTSTISALLASFSFFSALFVAFPDPPAGWGDDGVFLGDGTSGGLGPPADIQTTGSPSIVENTLTSNSWHTVKFHVSGTSISWYLDGGLLFTYTGGWSPGDLSGSYGIDFGAIFAAQIPGEVYFLDTVKIGTTDGGVDIFSDDFESGTFAAWDATFGDVSIVSSTGGVDFSLSLTPSTVTFTAPGTHAVSVDTISIGGDSESIALTVTGLPAGVTGSFSPTTIAAGGSSTFTLTAAAGTLVGTYVATVHATGADNTHTAPLTIVIAGTPLTRDTIVPPTDPGHVGSLLQQDTSPGTWIGNDGSITIHQGVPYVAWFEQGLDGDTLYLRGPYVAKWNGSDWDLLAGTGSALIPDWAATDTGVESWGPGVMTLRGDAVLASDGSNLYLACKGALAFQYLLHPGPPPVFYYASRWSILVWKWDGASWTEFGPGFTVGVGDLGVFSMIDWSMAAEDQAVASSSPISLVASPAEVGACYVAYSDWSTINIPTQPERGPGARTVAIGLGAASLAETAIEANASAPSADGVGSEFAVYYQQVFYPVSDASQVLIWTPGGSLSIPLAAFVWDETADSCCCPALSRIGGRRYLIVNVTDSSISNTTANLVLKIDPSTPDILTDLVAGHPELNMIQKQPTAVAFTRPDGDRSFWIDGSKNFWALLNHDGARNIYQLDRQCIETDSWNFAAQDGFWGAPIAFDGTAFLQYDQVNDVNEPALDPTSHWYAMVSKSTVCRGCQDCDNVLRGGVLAWNRVGNHRQ